MVTSGGPNHDSLCMCVCVCVCMCMSGGGRDFVTLLFPYLYKLAYSSNTLIISSKLFPQLMMRDAWFNTRCYVDGFYDL